MTTTTTRGRASLARVATGGLVAVLALGGCGTELAGSGSDLPVLRIGSARDSVGAAGANLASSDESKTRGSGAFTVRGTLPSGPSSAPVYRYGTGQADEARVRELAAAFGLDGAPARHSHGWEVTGAAGVLRVIDGGAHEWTFSRSTDECAAYLIGIDGPDTGTMSSCTRAVAVDGGPVAVASDIASGSGTTTSSALAEPSPTSDPNGQTDPSTGTGGGDDPVPPDAVPTPTVPTPTFRRPAPPPRSPSRRRSSRRSASTGPRARSSRGPAGAPCSSTRPSAGSPRSASRR